MAAVNFPDPADSPWTNPDNGVTYIYDSGVWKVLGGTPSGTDFVKLDDEGTKQVIKSAGIGISDGTNENITLGANGAGQFAGAVSADSGAFTNAVAADSATFTNAVTADSGAFANAVTADSGDITNALSAGSGSFSTTVSVTGKLTAGTFDLESLTPLS